MNKLIVKIEIRVNNKIYVGNPFGARPFAPLKRVVYQNIVHG